MRSPRCATRPHGPVPGALDKKALAPYERRKTSNGDGMGSNVILFELNEVPLKIIDYYVAARPSSNFARLMASSRVYESVSEDTGHLSPWITWPSVHRGVANSDHYISDFGQDLGEIDRAYPPVWQMLARAGVPTGVCGSLHSYPIPADRENYRFYIPDIFAADAQCIPAAIEPFQDFCLSLARESGRNVSSKVPLASATSLLRTLPELGITPKTVADLAGQILGERLDSTRLVRRRTYQSVLAFDVFMRQLEKRRPAFSTFFTNHVASAMHRYWAAVFPDEYETAAFDDEWRARFGDEIFFAMTKADEMLGRLLKHVDKHKDIELIVATSMGQEAVETEAMETQLYVTKPDRFVAQLGVERGEWKTRPAMLPSFNFEVPADKADYVAARLKSMTVNGGHLSHRISGEGFFSVDFGHPNLRDTVVMVGNEVVSLADCGLENVEIQDRSGTTAYHIPEGTLMIYDGRSRDDSKTQASTLDIAPYILAKFGVERPAYMRAPGAL